MLRIDNVTNRELRNCLLYGGVLRFLFFALLLICNEWIEPNVMVDDIKYELVAEYYMRHATIPIDINALYDSGAHSFLQVFWPYVMCISAKLFGTVYAGRVINIVLSLLCIKQIFLLTTVVSNNTKAGIVAARLFAYLPYPAFICCFPLKDIFLTFAVLYLLTVFVRWQKGENMSRTILLFSISLLAAVYYTRGAVAEFLILIALLFGLNRKERKNKAQYAVVFLLFGLMIIVGLWDSFVEAAEQKIEDYNSESYESQGMLRYIQINSLLDIWKLPATYLFAMIQPMTTNLFSGVWANWAPLLRIANISMYPIAFGNFYYMFGKKCNDLFWLSTFIMYACVISLSLGIFRHYLFLLPILFVNYACLDMRKSRKAKEFVRYGSAALFFLVLVLSFKSL